MAQTREKPVVFTIAAGIVSGVVSGIFRTIISRRSMRIAVGLAVWIVGSLINLAVTGKSTPLLFFILAFCVDVTISVIGYLLRTKNK